MPLNRSKKKTPMPTQKPEVRRRNFNEVALGYSEEEAVSEAQRCLQCKNQDVLKGAPFRYKFPSL